MALTDASSHHLLHMCSETQQHWTHTLRNSTMPFFPQKKNKKRLFSWLSIHTPFFSEPEAIPTAKAVSHQLSRMLTYHGTACGNKAVSLNTAEPPRRHPQRKEMLPVAARCCLAGAALSASVSLVHNWAIAELVISCSELSAANRIPPGCSSSPCPALWGGFLCSSCHLGCFLESQCYIGSGPVPRHSLGSATLEPDSVSYVGITSPFAAILQVGCLKHFPGKWRTKGQPPLLPREAATFVSHLLPPWWTHAILDQCTGVFLSFRAAESKIIPSSLAVLIFYINPSPDKTQGIPHQTHGCLTFVACPTHGDAVPPAQAAFCRRCWPRQLERNLIVEGFLFTLSPIYVFKFLLKLVKLSFMWKVTQAVLLSWGTDAEINAPVMCFTYSIWSLLSECSQLLQELL